MSCRLGRNGVPCALADVEKLAVGDGLSRRGVEATSASRDGVGREGDRHLRAGVRGRGNVGGSLDEPILAAIAARDLRADVIGRRRDLLSVIEGRIVIDDSKGRPQVRGGPENMIDCHVAFLSCWGAVTGSGSPGGA